MTTPIPAATLVLFRKGDTAAAHPPEHLFVERAATMAFAAGAIVFPGGRVDAGDYALAERHPDLDRNDAAARIAAIRETIEETGIAIGLTGPRDAATIARLRRHLHDGTPFADALAGAGLDLAVDALVPFARWCPNFKETRTFDTRFYLAALTDDDGEESVDATENVRLFWSSARDVLRDADNGRVRVIFPTRRNLERLAQFGSFAEAVRHAEAITPDRITPWVEERGGARHLCIPADRGYPITSEPIESASRG